MKTTESLSQLRRKAYLTYHQDGIIDMLIGATIIGFGLWRITGILIFTSASWLSFSFYVGLKRVITIPRFGFVRFEESQKKAQISILLGLLILLVMSVGALFLFTRPGQIPPALDTFLRKFHEFVLGGVGAVTLVLFGLLFGIRRVASYGILMLLALWIALQIGWPAGYTFISIGCLILGIGLVLLLRFMRTYPMQPKETGNAV